MNRTDFLIALIGSALVAGCEKGATAVTAPAPETSRDPGVHSAQIADAQKQYLSIEAVAVSQVVDLLALPGRVTFRLLAQSAIGATTARNAWDLIGSAQGIQITVRAPADGVVITIRTAVGATVAPGGEALLQLGDPARLQVVAQVPEGDLRRIAVGQEADVELPALAARVAARVENFNPRVDPESRRSQVYLALTKRIDGLRAGMLAQVALRVGAKADVLVPVSAVLIKDGKRRVVYV